MAALAPYVLTPAGALVVFLVFFVALGGLFYLGVYWMSR